MWQFEWMLGLIPDELLIWIYYAFMSAGLVCYIGSKFFKRFPFKYIPFLGQYPTLAELGGVALLCLGSFLYGGYLAKESWEERVKEVEAKVEVAKKESEEANIKLEAKRKEKQKVRIEYYTTVKEQIVEKEKLIDAECKLDPVVLKLHNAAAANPAKVDGVKK